MLSWDLPNSTAPKSTRAAKCPLNPGVLDPLGNEKYYPSRMWVDDALIAAVGVFGMKMALASVIEAISIYGHGQTRYNLEAVPFGHGQMAKFSSG